MNPGSICHPDFVVSKNWYYHLPFAGHSGRGVLAFTDSHVETRRWTDPATKNPNRDLSNHLTGNTKNADLQWLLQHASVAK
jgi:hypothetical protein